MSTTASTSSFMPVSPEKLRQAIRDLDLIPLPSQQWVLISPDGKMWTGQPEALLMVLAPHHPLLKGPT